MADFAKAVQHLTAYPDLQPVRPVDMSNRWQCAPPLKASVWVTTALMAFVAARNRNFEVHRQWMMRSYSITMIFVVSRIILALHVIAPTTDLGAERLGWILIICALLVPQLIINGPQLFSRPRTIRTGTSLESVNGPSRRRN